MAAAAYGGLASVARARGELAQRQQRFAAIERAVSGIERDFAQAVSRPVRGNFGELQPALLGGGDRIELTRLGFANPLAEPRSHLERVVYRLSDDELQRGRYAVLDRAPASAPQIRVLADRTERLALRYLARDGSWSDAWPPRDVDADASAGGTTRETALPRAIEVTLRFADAGEIRRVVELPSALPQAAADQAGGTVPARDAGEGAPALPPTALEPAPGGNR
jgi:general secretion pathway protein J